MKITFSTEEVQEILKRHVMVMLGTLAAGKEIIVSGKHYSGLSAEVDVAEAEKDV